MPVSRTAESASAEAPARGGLVLTALILSAAVANLNLAVANVALPSIGQAFDASQTQLNLIAVGYSLGLAASVLYLGAMGDRYGRKLLLLLGLVLSVPACLMAAYAPDPSFLFVARVVGGLSAGLAFPTTLALITALWSGPRRTRTIALWSAIGGGISALGPLIAGFLLQDFWWGSVFLVTLPLAVVAFVMAWVLVPAHVNETSDPVDHLGGILSVLLAGGLVLGINFAAVPGAGALVLGMAAIALAALIAFVVRQRRARNPLYDLHVAARPTFWVAACAGAHRLRIPHGRHVHRAAAPAERARVRQPRGRRRDPPDGLLHGPRRTPFGEARGVHRGESSPADGVCVRPARLPHHAAAVEGGLLVLGSRAGLRPRGRRRGVRGNPRVALADRLRSGDTGRHGLRNSRPAA